MNYSSFVSRPTKRRIAIYAFDPGVAQQHDNLDVSSIVLEIPWEPLEPGPIGEYIEVVDVDPASDIVYFPVNLDHPDLIARNGHVPSETNPQFHQQMTYAVAMATIGHFTKALGRPIFWSQHRESAVPPQGGEEPDQWQFVRRLRIYPHALRERNAYYSPHKKAVLFGYFAVDRKDRHNVPGTIVFTALSHDIIAHEVTHAILDGIHPRFAEPNNPDVLAFHEGFADLVALFQHFAYPGVLRAQMARTRGNLETETILGQLAQQFGRAAGRGDSLRDAIGGVDPETGVWTLHDPDPTMLERVLEPHDRGSILVAAVFGAFLTLYKSATRDLYRIATEGTGVLRAGDIHPDLVNRLAGEAAKIAGRILQLCIRALDYCPPFGITFGDYLRAIITADHDLWPDDEAGYRVAIVEAFRRWGIYPQGLRSMSVESLLWPSDLDQIVVGALEKAGPTLVARTHSVEAALQSAKTVFSRAPATKAAVINTVPLSTPPSTFSTTASSLASPPERELAEIFRQRQQQASDRLEIWKQSEEQAKAFWSWLSAEEQVLLDAIGIVFHPAAPLPSVYQRHGRYKVHVQAIRTAVRTGKHGAPVTEMVVEILQRRRGYFDRDRQAAIDSGLIPITRDDKGDFTYRAGCTLLIDPVTMQLRRVIRTAGTIEDSKALDRMRRFLSGEGLDPVNAFDSAVSTLRMGEPFAVLHRGNH